MAIRGFDFLLKLRAGDSRSETRKVQRDYETLFESMRRSGTQTFGTLRREQREWARLYEAEIRRLRSNQSLAGTGYESGTGVLPPGGFGPPGRTPGARDPTGGGGFGEDPLVRGGARLFILQKLLRGTAEILFSATRAQDALTDVGLEADYAADRAAGYGRVLTQATSGVGASIDEVREALRLQVKDQVVSEAVLEKQTLTAIKLSRVMRESVGTTAALAVQYGRITRGGGDFERFGAIFADIRDSSRATTQDLLSAVNFAERLSVVVPAGRVEGTARALLATTGALRDQRVNAEAINAAYEEAQQLTERSMKLQSLLALSGRDVAKALADPAEFTRAIAEGVQSIPKDQIVQFGAALEAAYGIDRQTMLELHRAKIDELNAALDEYATNTKAVEQLNSRWEESTSTLSRTYDRLGDGLRNIMKSVTLPAAEGATAALQGLENKLGNFLDYMEIRKDPKQSPLGALAQYIHDEVPTSVKLVATGTAALGGLAASLKTAGFGLGTFSRWFGQSAPLAKGLTWTGNALGGVAGGALKVGLALGVASVAGAGIEWFGKKLSAAADEQVKLGKIGADHWTVTLAHAIEEFGKNVKNPLGAVEKIFRGIGDAIVYAEDSHRRLLNRVSSDKKYVESVRGFGRHAGRQTGNAERSLLMAIQQRPDDAAYQLENFQAGLTFDQDLQKYLRVAAESSGRTIEEETRDFLEQARERMYRQLEREQAIPQRFPWEEIPDLPKMDEGGHVPYRKGGQPMVVGERRAEVIAPVDDLYRAIRDSGATSAATVADRVDAAVNRLLAGLARLQDMQRLAPSGVGHARAVAGSY